MSGDEAEARTAGGGGKKVELSADMENEKSPRALSLSPSVTAQGRTLGSSRDGVSLDSAPKGRDGGGDGPGEGPDPLYVPDSMETGEIPSDLLPAAAWPSDLPPSNAQSLVLLPEKTDSDSDMDFAAVKNIRKQHAQAKMSLNKRRKKERDTTTQ
ncbi:hypothetical protein ABVT39_026640 [Epinephelus coioides]